MGKRDKERQVPISELCVKVLRRYLEVRPRDTTCDLFFLGVEGEGLTPNAVYQRIRALGKKAGIERTRCSPHTFRHTFATNFIKDGGEALVLKDILGHEKLSTVLIYVHLARGEDLTPAHDRYTPLKRFRIRPDAAEE